MSERRLRTGKGVLLDVALPHVAHPPCLQSGGVAEIRPRQGWSSRAYTYLEKELAEPDPQDQGWWPAYTAWQTFAVKVLVEGGRNQDSNINRLYQRLDRMPVFAMSYLLDALIAKGETNGARIDELHRRMMNAILPEGGSAHVEELNDPYLMWFWNSNAVGRRRLPFGVDGSSADVIVRQTVRWLLNARRTAGATPRRTP
jgi:hypothetical protein